MIFLTGFLLGLTAFLLAANVIAYLKIRTIESYLLKAIPLTKRVEELETKMVSIQLRR